VFAGAAYLIDLNGIHAQCLSVRRAGYD
jgi:hypothetical protein